MLRQLVRFSLQQRFLVIALAAGLVVAGVVSVLRSPVDVFPEFAPPLVEVQVEAPGMSSEAVESLVTIPLESALNGLPRMTVIRSKSVQGLSAVQMLFEQGSDIFQVRQMVNERVAAAARILPPTVKPPQLLPPLSSTSRILKLGLYPKKKPDGTPACTTTDISVLMRWIIDPRLRAVPGVSNVSTYGLHDRVYQIQIDPVKMRDKGVTLDQVRQAASRAVVMGSSGFLDNENQRLAVQYATKLDHFDDLKQLVLIQRRGEPIRLGEVAELETGSPPAIGEGVVNDEVGLLVVVEKYPWANTFQVTKDVEKAIDALRPGLPDVEINTTIFRPATFIERAVNNLQHAMIMGCILVSIIVVAFLMNLRTAVISLTAIPLSIVAALLVLNLTGHALNTMILAGLVIAVGEVVDDAIIDVENITRRLRQQSQPLARWRVILAASLEVRSAVVYATAIVALVCLPIFFLGGVAGSFFRPLATAYILAVLASLIVALTVTPALSLILLPRNMGTGHDPLLARIVRGIYRRALAPILVRPVFALIVVGGMLAGAIVLLPRFKEEYLPQFQETDFLMHWIAKPGTSIHEVTRDIQLVSKDLRTKTTVRDFGSHIARAEIGEEVVGSNFAELWVSLKDDYGNYAAARKKIMAVMDHHSGYQHDLLTYLQERIKEVLTGTGASVVVRIYGPDLETLRNKAKALADAINGKGYDGKVPGVVDLKVEAQDLIAQLELIIDAQQAAALGLSPGAIADAVTIYINGLKVGDVHQKQGTFDLVLMGSPSLRKNPWPSLLELPIDVPQPPGDTGRSATVPLKSVATLKLINAPNIVRHDKASRCIDVTCNIQPNADLGAVVREIQTRAQPLNQESYRIEFLGEFAARQENQRQLLGVALLSILGIAVLIYSDFRSVRLTFLVLATLPFALIGGVFSAYFTGAVLSLGTLVGFITVLGIAARNGIMLVSHYRHLQQSEGVPFGRELVVRGASERVVPIMMTALAAGIGLLPLALGGNQPGYEIEYPMAIVILGGLFTSTVLNLLVVPALYQWFGRAGAVKLDKVVKPTGRFERIVSSAKAE